MSRNSPSINGFGKEKVRCRLTLSLSHSQWSVGCLNFSCPYCAIDFHQGYRNRYNLINFVCNFILFVFWISSLIKEQIYLPFDIRCRQKLGEICITTYHISTNSFLPSIVSPFNSFYSNYSIYEVKNFHDVETRYIKTDSPKRVVKPSPSSH